MNIPSLLSNRTVIRLSGEDRLSFLQGLITQDVELLKDQPAIFTTLLTPQGKILFDFFIIADGDELFIDCHDDAAQALIKRLSLYKLRAKVAIESATDKKIIVSHEAIDGGYVDPRHERLGWRAIVSDANIQANTDYDKRRIALGIPEFGKDFGSDEMFLLDVNYDALNGVSYQKGCFIGQEVASRMKRKSEARRRTLIASFDGSTPEKGAAVMAGASTLGEIMSSADGKALVQIRLDRWEKAKADQTSIECGGAELQLQIPAYLEQG